MTNRCAALATTVGMVAGVHNGTTAAGTHAHVALAACLAQVDVLVVDVGNLTDDCGAVHGHVAHLTGGQTNQSVAILLSHQLSHVASGTNQLSAAAGIQLDVVDDGTDGDVLEGQAVAGLDVGRLAADDHVAHLQAIGSNDVALDAIGVLDQSDECAAVRIVLESLDGSGHIGLLTLEVDDTILGAVAAALMTDGDTTGVVAAAVLLHGLQQAALGSDLGQDAVIRDGHAAAARSSGAILFDSHCAILLCLSYELLSGSYPHRGTLGGFGLDHAVEELDLLGVLGQGHDSLLGCSGVTSVHTLTAEAATDGDGVHLSDLDAGEQNFNCLSDLDLGSIGSDLEGVLLVSDASHGVLGNDRLQDDIMCGFH